MPRHSPSRLHARLSRALAAVLLGTSLLSTGCATDTGLTAEERATASPIVYDDYAALGYALDWRSFPYVTPGQRVEHVLIDDDIIATLEGGSFITVMEADDGSFRWRLGISNELSVFRDLKRRNDTILVVGDADLFMLELAGGTITGRQSFDPISNSGVALARNILSYGSNRGQLVGHLLEDPGVKFWGYLTSGPIAHAPVLLETPAGTAVAAASADGSVVFATADRGRLLGRARMFAGPGAQPVAGAGLFFVGSLDQSVYAFAPDAARPVWRHRTERPVTAPPTFHDGALYVELDGTGMTALNAIDGAIRWSNPELTGQVIGLRNNRLVVWDESGRTMHTADPTTGDIITAVSLPSIRWAQVQPFVGGDLFTISEAEVFARFRPR